MKQNSAQLSRLSIAASDIGEYRDGYMSNIEFDKDSQAGILALQQKIGHMFSDGIWFQPKDSLHITLFDFIAPKVEYDVSRSELFCKQQELIFKTMEQLAIEFHEFTIQLNAIHVSQSAIYVQGEDDGSIHAMRNRFTELYDLDERTKKPPIIIHSTIGRFTDVMDIHELNEYTRKIKVDINVHVENLRVVHERKLPMLEYEILNTWELQHEANS